MISICDDQSIISYFHVEVPGFCMSSSAVPFSVFACLWLCVCVWGGHAHMCVIGRESWIFPILFCEDNKTVDSIFVAIYSASRFFLHQEVFLQYPDHDTHRTGSLVHSFGINFITEVHISKHNIALFCILFQIKGIKL